MAVAPGRSQPHGRAPTALKMSMQSVPFCLQNTWPSPVISWSDCPQSTVGANLRNQWADGTCSVMHLLVTAVTLITWTPRLPQGDGCEHSWRPRSDQGVARGATLPGGRKDFQKLDGSLL